MVVVSLVISALALALSVVLPVWERYVWPKLVVLPPPPGVSDSYRLRVINLRREPLEVKVTWLQFEDDHQVDCRIYDEPGGMRDTTIPARSAADFVLMADEGIRAAASGFFTTNSIVTGFCEDKVGRVSRSRPIDITDGMHPEPLSGWVRMRLWVRWWIQVITRETPTGPGL
jgi:hypothetical protein